MCFGKFGIQDDWTTGYHTMEVNGGSTASSLVRTLCVPVLLLILFNRSGSKGAFRLPGATWDRFRCTVEPSPGHVWRRKVPAPNGGAEESAKKVLEALRLIAASTEAQSQKHLLAPSLAPRLGPALPEAVFRHFCWAGASELCSWSSGL